MTEQKKGYLKDKLMNYVVIDLEWNQPSDWKNSGDPGLCFEIIEIGAVLLDENRKQIKEFSRIIKPQVYKKMNYITRGIVNISKEELENGEFFEDVMKEFLSWCGEDYIFCTWGPGDLVELQRNMKYYGMPDLAKGPFPYLDVQKLYGLDFEGKKSARALDHAVAALGIEQDAPFHRALSDAFYTGKILSAIRSKELLTRYSYDTYHIPKNRASEMHLTFPGYQKYISRGFMDKATAMQDREVLSSRCIVCGKKLRKCVRNFSPGGKYYLNVARCEEDGYMKSKIRLKKTDAGKIYVIKTQKMISPDEMAEIAGRRAHIMEVKRIKESLLSRPVKKD